MESKVHAEDSIPEMILSIRFCLQVESGKENIAITSDINNRSVYSIKLMEFELDFHLVHFFCSSKHFSAYVLGKMKQAQKHFPVSVSLLKICNLKF